MLISLEWKASKNTYFEASSHTCESGLQNRVNSNMPNPQHPTFVTSIPIPYIAQKRAGLV